jgi:hypothetical protein
VLAVCVTGVLSIVIPFGLLLGKDGLVTAGVNRQAAVPTAVLVGCPDGPAVRTDAVPAGQCVQITGSGFGAGALIEVTESRRRGWHSYLRADVLGRFRWRYLLAANAPSGPDVLTFVSTDRSDPATIPAAAFCRFTVIG